MRNDPFDWSISTVLACVFVAMALVILGAIDWSEIDPNQAWHDTPTMFNTGDGSEQIGFHEILFQETPNTETPGDDSGSSHTPRRRGR